MARGITKDITQYIQELDEKIDKEIEKVRALRIKRQELLNKKDAIAMQEIIQILQEKNITTEQAVEILRNHQ